MATKSILKNIYITSTEDGQSLVKALENAVNAYAKDFPFYHTYEDADKEKIRDILKNF